ncbi:unnamed protein product [Rotaria sordida]|uniref:Uncharacterized protein n=1 Tax=Rotaria sordida TaxID=392033 RepID=A0A813SZ08_9BILA|nr:unnamed protein product [Rotaria sordida]CAF0807333.1 unnamed protein product [Rotaria sordida]
MTDNTNETIISSRMATRSTTTTTTTNPRTTNTKNGYERLAQLYPHVGDDIHLPTKWNGKDKASTLILQQNDLVVTYKGPGKTHKDAASVRSDHPIPPLTGIYYFEVKILSKGRDGYMGIGLSTGEVNLSRLPGWDKGSYGYHGDDGHSFCSSGSGIVYGPTFTTGDYVGCCVNFLENSCFYTRNGYNLGTSFKDIPTEIYPTVGLQTPHEAIEANFGLNPFKFDIEKYMDEYREKTRRAIIECTLKEGELLHQTQLRRIVSTYLVHYGYCATAEQFNKNAESVYADELNSMRNRQLIQHLILDGRTTDAIDKTRELFPTLLNDKNLLFVLKVRQFIEMVNGTESEIRKTSISCPPSTFSQTTTTTNCPSPTNHLINNKNRSNSPSCSSSLTNKNYSHSTTSPRSSSPITKTNTSLRSRSNSPYTSGRTQTTTISGAQQHSNGTISSSSRRSSANNLNELSQETNNESSLSEIPCQSSESNSHTTTVNSVPSNTNTNVVVNLMDIDDNHQDNNTANGFSNHGTVSHPHPSSSSSSSSTNQISNGHSLLDDDNNNLVVDNNMNSNGCSTKSTDILDGMEYDGYTDSIHTMDMETTISSDVQKKSTTKEDDQLLVRILQFGRELHALKQQLTIEHGDNQQNDKLLQDAFSLLAYSDPKSSPLAHLLEPSQRETVSSAVNSAILEAHDMPRHPALEVLVGYLHECDKLMHKNNIPDCAFIDLNKYLR